MRSFLFRSRAVACCTHGLKDGGGLSYMIGGGLSCMREERGLSCMRKRERDRINPTFSTVLSQKSKLLVIAQLHPHGTKYLTSNMHFHSTLQVPFLSVHSNREVVHLAYTSAINNGSSLLFHRKSNRASPRFVLSQNMRERYPRLTQPLSLPPMCKSVISNPANGI